MLDPRNKNKELKSPGYEIFVGALSVLSIVNIVLLYGVNDNVLNWQPSGVANYPIIRGVGVTD